METTAGLFITRFAKISGLAFLPVVAFSLFLEETELFALTLGYLLSFLFVGSNLLITRKIDLEDHQRFMRIFFVSLALRFILVLVSIIFVLKAIKIHQIYFTVSFIISYIFHSVIEIIFVNKILETDN